MEAKELRLNNLVILKRDFYTYKKGDIFALSNVGVDYLDRWQQMGASDELKITDVEPIPLTEEWLVKFGFVKGQDGWYSNKTICFNENLVCYFNSTNDVTELNHIKYVHQLQNLYFALTNTELTLNI